MDQAEVGNWRQSVPTIGAEPFAAARDDSIFRN
jgi:hypothetical protein